MFGAFLAIVCGIVAFGIYGQAAESRSLDSQVVALQQQNTALQQQIAERQQQVVEAQTYAWLVEEARKLGYVFPGEKSFVLTGPGAPAAAQGGVQAPLPTFEPPTPVPTPKPSHRPSPSPTPLHLTVPSPSPSA
ncbi:MAG: septum formation initiator family protein [Candidatus Dormibacteraeota bacterium]|nr:septum formation initiator family protein [Candidatus Dormibacteraeota bacterium]MBV8444570.1 septum formation initiator family protein [Candidatus Dormibacteraeota bacterium]